MKTASGVLVKQIRDMELEAGVLFFLPSASDALSSCCDGLTAECQAEKAEW